RIIRKSGAMLHDHLLLSKPLGVGMIVRAYRVALVDEGGLEEAMNVMLMSNRHASERALAVGVHCATDVSGFGLLGHLSQMLLQGQGAVLDFEAIPVIPSVSRVTGRLSQTFWSEQNLDYVRSRVELKGFRNEPPFYPLLDPQTNGGLLVSAPASAVAGLTEAGFRRIGEVTECGVIELSF
ncbi:MAG: AIR synthase-related protein, partial [Opitutaceae bacterium]|nr:AIR synthase-related protein [Opitutaceae bacterium]